MADTQLEDIEPTGIDEHPVTDSVKLHGPPGTGKTTQSAGRVGRLLRDHGYELSEVAWATYRRSLAFDTLERFVDWGLLDEAELKEPHKGATRYISTIHAVANRTVGELPDPVEFWHKRDFCSRLDLQFQSQEPWEETPGQLLFSVFEYMKNNLRDPANEADVRACPKIGDLREHWNGSVPAAWNRWEDYKAQRDIIDFYEMLEAPLDANKVPTTDVLVVDEYHDATPLMAKLCEFWIDAADISIVAGDPNQVVNAYDGASPEFFEILDLPRVLLDYTYRVPNEHWNAATQLLQRAHEVPPVDRSSDGLILEYRSPTFAYGSEAGWDSPTPSQTAGPASIVEEYGENTLFLTRMQMQADGIGHALERAGILYASQKELHGWNTERGERRLSVFNALQKIRGFKPGHFDRGGGLSRFGEAPRSPSGTELATEEAAALLNHVHAKYLAEPRSAIDDVVDDIEQRGREPSLTELDDWVETEFWSTHTAGEASVDRLNKGRLKDRDRMALKEALRRYSEPVNSDDLEVRVLTIHASKGQEAEDVVVYDGISRRIRREMRGSESTRKNECRTWFVALTRASKRLHIMRDAFEWTTSFIPDDIRQHAGGGLRAAD